jgi:hypothetical protein
VRQFVVIAGAIVGLGVARKGSEVRCRFGLAGQSLVIRVGSRELRLELGQIERLDYDLPFGGSLSWLPATVLVDRGGRSWRIPALVEGGDQLITDLLQRADRHDLYSWADVYHIVARMGRARQWVRAGYAVAAAVLLAGIAYYVH